MMSRAKSRGQVLGVRIRAARVSKRPVRAATGVCGPAVNVFATATTDTPPRFARAPDAVVAFVPPFEIGGVPVTWPKKKGGPVGAPRSTN